MTLQQAMENCKECHDFKNENPAMQYQTQVFILEDAFENGLHKVDEAASLHYLMLRACKICKYEKPAVYNLGKAHLRE